MGSFSRSSFFGFEIAKTGLFINQHNLNVTGHNISNVNTPGYTRQRLVTSAIEPYSSIGKLAPMEHGLLGGGVRSHYIEQLRSAYLDRQYRAQSSTENTWTTRTSVLEFIEQIFDEPNEVGVLDMLQKDFYNSLSDLQTKSISQAARAVVQANAKKLTETLNQFYRQLVEMQSNQNREIGTKVDRVNQLAEEVRDLNKLIYNSEMNGEHANDLRDKRNLALDELSSLVEIEVNEYRNDPDEPAMLSVKIGTGASAGFLVDHKTVNKLMTEEVNNPIEPDTHNITGQPDEKLLTICWANGYTVTSGLAPTDNISGSITTPADLGKMFNLTGHGSINGTLTVRDGDSNQNMGIPYFVQQLNALASSLVAEFNAVHKTGFTHPSPETGNVSIDDINFFDDYGGGVAITAGNFKLSDEVLQSVWNIACSSEEVKLGENEGNNINTLKSMLGLLTAKNLATVGNFGEYYRQFLVDVGTTTAFSRKEAESNAILADSCDTQRMSISAVSIDEEMTNLIRFQHAYAASSRVITAMDEALEKLINGTGIVGR